MTEAEKLQRKKDREQMIREQEVWMQARCSCGHGIAAHADSRPANERTFPCASCPCKRFTEAAS
jgi:hypothetical protein